MTTCNHDTPDMGQRFIAIEALDAATETRCPHARTLDVAFELANLSGNKTCGPVEAIASLAIAIRILASAACEDETRRASLVDQAFALSDDVGVDFDRQPTGEA